MEYLIAITLGAAFAWNGVFPLLVVLIGGTLLPGILTSDVQPWATSAWFFVIVGFVAIAWFIVDRVPLRGWLGLIGGIRTAFTVLVGLACLTLTMLTLAAAFEGAPGVESAFDLRGAVAYGTGLVTFLITRVFVAELRQGDRPRVTGQTLRRTLRRVQDLIAVVLTVLAAILPIAGAIAAVTLLVIVWRAGRRRDRGDVATGTGSWTPADTHAPAASLPDADQDD